MSTPEEIRDALSEQLVTGDAERQIADRRIRKYNPKDVLEAAQGLATASSSPFMRVGFKRNDA